MELTLLGSQLESHVVLLTPMTKGIGVIVVSKSATWRWIAVSVVSQNIASMELTLDSGVVLGKLTQLMMPHTRVATASSMQVFAGAPINQ